MRRLTALSLGLFLAAPFSARADGPEPTGFATHYGGHICAKCAARLPKRLPSAGPNSPPPYEVVAGTAGCAACEAAGNASLANLPPGTIILGPGETLGVAQVGGEAPGVAYVGGPTSSEPAPIGVMRTNYQAGAAAPMNPNLASPYANPASGSARPGIPAPMGQSMSYPGHRRTSVLGHMFGLRRAGAMSARRQAQERAQHAAISYGNENKGPDSLPASMVYGQR